MCHQQINKPKQSFTKCLDHIPLFPSLNMLQLWNMIPIKQDRCLYLCQSSYKSSNGWFCGHHNLRMFIFNHVWRLRHIVVPILLFMHILNLCNTFRNMISTCTLSMHTSLILSDASFLILYWKISYLSTLCPLFLYAIWWLEYGIWWSNVSSILVQVLMRNRNLVIWFGVLALRLV